MDANSLAAPDQASDVREIEKLLRGELPIAENSPQTFPVRAVSQSASRRRPSQQRHEQQRRDRRDTRPASSAAAPVGATSPARSEAAPASARSLQRGRTWSSSRGKK